ncbi:MAG: 2',3'-cyclic-nucleotide 2'-phosphodiesterase (5'-nucleotidase family) [Nitrospinales bacterium]|jgi:2',3'-cyclic-nucleotide 2'-phosphodiesterase (5'-nucleotidase family)
MKRFAILLLVFLTACLAPRPDLPSPVAAETQKLLVVYTGNLLAELKPCGCAKEEDQGGIERRMQYLNDIRKNKPNLLLVDTGDHFKEPTRQGKLKAKTLMTATEKMGYDAVALGERDLVYGSKFLRSHSIPFIASNIALQNFPLQKKRIKKFSNGLNVAVLAVVDPDLFYLKNHAGLNIADPEQTLSQEIVEIQKTADIVILLTHMKKEKALKYLDKDGVDIVINGHITNEADTVDMKPVYKAEKIFVQASPRGQKMGELHITLDEMGKITFEQRMVKLDSSINKDPEMLKLYESYNNEVEAMFFESLAAKRNKDKVSIYAGDTVCKTCHSIAHDKWSSSRHGRAYETLRKINKAFDPECLVCHVVGYNTAGGFISELDTPELKNVQCEVCHGAGKKHASAPAPGFGNNAHKACKRCHVKNHSPRFNFTQYWPKIKH